MILSKDADAVIALFEELGFKHNHVELYRYAAGSS